MRFCGPHLAQTLQYEVGLLNNETACRRRPGGVGWETNAAFTGSVYDSSTKIHFCRSSSIFSKRLETNVFFFLEPITRGTDKSMSSLYCYMIQVA